MNATRLTCLIAVVVCISFGSCGKAGSGPVTTSSSTNSPASGGASAVVTSADAIVHQVADFYRKAAAAEVEVVDSLPIAIPNVPSTRTVKLSIQRPDKLAVRGTGELSVDTIQNGTTTYTVLTPVKKYVETPSAGNLDALAKAPSSLGMMGWGVMFAPSLFCTDPYQAMMDGVNSVELVGKESIENIECHRIKFNQPNLVWEMWVAASGDPLVMKMEFDRLPIPIMTGTNKFAVVYKNWKLQSQLPAETFTYKPAEGFEKVNDVAGLLGGLSGGLPDVSGGLPQIPGLPEIPGFPGIPGAPPAKAGGQPAVPGGLPGVPGDLPAVPGSLPTSPGGTPGTPPSPPAGEQKPAGPSGE